MKKITIDGVEYVNKKEADLAIQVAEKKKGKNTNSTNEKVIPFQVGEKYFIRTVTYFATGRVAAIHGDFLELEDAAWIADSGRFNEAINKGNLNEVEPVDVPMYLNINSIVDVFVWKHELPRIVK